MIDLVKLSDVVHFGKLIFKFWEDFEHTVAQVRKPQIEMPAGVEGLLFVAHRNALRFLLVSFTLSVLRGMHVLVAVSAVPPWLFDIYVVLVLF